MGKRKYRIIKRERSAKTGRFVKNGTEKKKPAQTVVERIKIPVS